MALTRRVGTRARDEHSRAGRHNYRRSLRSLYRTRRRFDVVIRRLDINLLVIDHVTLLSLVDVHAYLLLTFLGQLFVLELHLNKPETSSSLRGSVSHDDCVGYDAELFKILDKVALYRKMLVNSKYRLAVIY